jgi:two-component system LytT family sensor kinase
MWSLKSCVTAAGLMFLFPAAAKPPDLMIAPLLLLPFIENSFKHGVSKQLDQCWINLHLHAENHSFTFHLSNSCSKEKSQDMLGELVCRNIQKRLELIYAGNYSLSTIQEEEMYAVKLTMQLSSHADLEASKEISFVHTLPAAAI